MPKLQHQAAIACLLHRRAQQNRADKIAQPLQTVCLFNCSCSVLTLYVRGLLDVTIFPAPTHTSSLSLTLFTLTSCIASLCSCKLQRETERRAVRSARSELESSSSASLSSSLPSQLPPSRGHLNRVPEHESGDCLSSPDQLLVLIHQQ